jgi:hypothetical protein
MAGKLLSKSTYLAGIQCPKLLWIKVNDKKRLQEPDETLKLRFKKGYEIENHAKSLFEESIAIPIDGFMEGINQTKKLIKKRKTLLEEQTYSSQ